MHSGGLEITFGVLDEGASAIPVDDIRNLRSDLDGPYAERPEPVADARFQAWIMSVAGTRVVIVVKSYPDTAPARLEEAEEIVDSIYSEPRDTGAGYRLVFELPAGWDSG